MYEQISSNKWRSVAMIVVFIAFVGFLGLIFGYVTRFGPFGLVIALAVAGVMAWSSYYFSDRMVLAMSGAKAVTHDEYPHLYNVVEGISIAAGTPMPKLYVIDAAAPNAFATGRDPEHSAVAVTTGLMQMMDRLQLEGVIAHEMSHIRNYDIRLMTLASVMVGTVILLSDWLLRSFWFGGDGDRDEEGGLGIILLVVGLVMAIVAPIVAQLMQLALSRNREYLADASGAMLTRYPEGLAGALEKLGGDKHQLPQANKATAHLWIAQPLNTERRLNRLFDTHPPLEDRIRRLREMAFEEPTS